MKHRLLILCDAFVPPMYGTRVRNLVQNLSKDTWEVHVACEQVPEYPYALPDAQMHCWQYYPEKRGIGRLLWYWRWLIDKMFLAKEKRFLGFLNREFERQTFDMVFASAYIFPIYSTRMFVQRRHIPLVMDMRDIFEQWGNTGYNRHSDSWFSNIYRTFASCSYSRITRERNLTLKAAAAVTTVSSWHRKVLSSFNPDTHVIYNGYDNSLFVPHDSIQDEFKIVYTGSIYNLSLRNPDLLMQALQQLPELRSVYVDWYTDADGRQQIHKMAEAYGIASIMRYHDYVTPDKIASVLHSAGIVLVLSNLATDCGPHGILTTKFFEALGVEKPVLCVRSDEECLAQVINETNAGIAATNVEQVRQFVLDKYNEWQEHGFTRQQVNLAVKQQFSRQYQAEQFEHLFISLL